MAADVENNPKSFYRYMRTKTKSKDRVGPLKDSAENVIEDDNRMCDTLNNFFASVFTQENTDYMFRKSTVFLMVIAVSCYVLLILHLRLYSIKQVVSIIRIETICGPLVVRSRSRSHRSRSTIYPFEAAPHPRGCR